MKRITACFAMLLLASCSAGFNREWRQALENEKGTAPHDLTGPWQGTWKSEVSGHQGKLRCIVSLADKGGATPDSQTARIHRFHYHATFLNVFSATYDVTHRVHRQDGLFKFRGDQKLAGMGGGLYHYDGTGTPAHFSAAFRSDSDHGVFELKRP